MEKYFVKSVGTVSRRGPGYENYLMGREEPQGESPKRSTQKEKIVVTEA